MIEARAAHLISSLRLAPHPEGGHFRRIHQSASRVQPLDERSPRAALTTIYFLLAAGEVSRWHSVASDEVWHHYEGAALELFTIDFDFGESRRHVVGPVSDDAQPVQTVPAHCWQAARSTGAYTLLGCTVGPGFEFADFRMLRDLSAETERMRERHPDLASLL